MCNEVRCVPFRFEGPGSLIPVFLWALRTFLLETFVCFVVCLLSCFVYFFVFLLAD
jgi:hypothetical protein